MRFDVVDRVSRPAAIAAALCVAALSFSLARGGTRGIDVTRPEWAFVPVARVIPPANSDPWINNPIDAFVLEKLTQNKLRPSPPADRRTLIRRLYLDMHGLPPTPDQVAAFVADTSPQAYSNLVEQVLASPRYGERWAQHWLDVVRYADTTGYEYNGIRKDAWPYRDYVIRAMNEDRPWDRFIFEQLAGDTVGEDAATGFLVTAPLPSPAEVGKEPAAIRQARYNSLDEMLQNVGSSMLGLTVQCARCHNHKFDPIRQTDYYALVACLAGVNFEDREWRTPATGAALDLRRQCDLKLAANTKALEQFPHEIQVAGSGTTERFTPVTARFIRITITATDRTSEGPAFDEIEVFDAPENGVTPQNVALASKGGKATSSGAARQLKSDDAQLNDGAYGPSSVWIADRRPPAWVQIELPRPMRIDRIVWSRDRDLERQDPLKAAYRKATEWYIEYAAGDGKDWKPVAPPGVSGAAIAKYDALTAERKLLQDEISKLSVKPVVFAGTFSRPMPSNVLVRGDPEQMGDPVVPASPTALPGRFELPSDVNEQARRVAFARWIGSRENPLTARVLVNRVWALHFGTGIVDTPGDFGRMGATPSHPELLDWLAARTIESSWSLKMLHRLILNSSTYRQISTPTADEGTALAIDASSRLLWRFPPRRMEAEVIHDSILQSAGTLDLTMGGPPVNFYQPKPDFGEYVPLERSQPEAWRRMIYLLHARGADDGVFSAFDVPDCGQVRPKRNRSTTPIQALNLFNSSFVAEQAMRFADRVKHEVGADPDAQIRGVFGVALSRDPTALEMKGARAAVEHSGLATLCRAILNSNEFVVLP